MVAGFFCVLNFCYERVTNEMWHEFREWGSTSVIFSEGFKFCISQKGMKEQCYLLWPHILVCQFSPALLVFLKKHGMHIKCFLLNNCPKQCLKRLKSLNFFFKRPDKNCIVWKLELACVCKACVNGNISCMVFIQQCSCSNKNRKKKCSYSITSGFCDSPSQVD